MNILLQNTIKSTETIIFLLIIIIIFHLLWFVYERVYIKQFHNTFKIFCISTNTSNMLLGAQHDRIDQNDLGLSFF